MQSIEPNWAIRKALPGDIASIREVYRSSILFLGRSEYDAGQIRAWAATADRPGRWKETIARQYFLVACVQDRIIGFASLEKDYVDFLYVHPDFARQGVARSLLQQLEAEARRNGETALYAHVSRSARAFFENQGYRITDLRQVIIDGVTLENFRMTKEEAVRIPQDINRNSE